MKRIARLFIAFFLLALAGASVLLYWQSTRVVPATPPREEVSVTFVEGRTLKEYGVLLAERGLISSLTTWQKAVGTASPRYTKLFPELFADKPAEAGLEGYFFPDTYRLYKDTSPRHIIEKALSEMNAHITPEMRAEIARGHHTIFEVLTMASLVEAEGKTAEDRAVIADILWRRLDVGMPLQVDSSLVTYKNTGLPAAPINNPSLVSIKAAVHPTVNQYWYFISGRDGAMHYARTFVEHQRNIARYLR